MHKMKNSLIKLVIVSVLGLGTAFCSAQSFLEKGTKYYNLRAEKHEGLKVDSTNINLAIEHLNKALASDNEKATALLLQAYYFKAAFVVRAKDEQKRNWLLGKSLGEKGIKSYPKNKHILLWYIANYSKYGEAQGVIASAKNGLADKMKSFTEKLLQIDSTFNDGAAHKILGVLHYKVPKIPLLISWPNKSLSKYHLTAALKLNPKSISNLYYYAEYLFEVDKQTESKLILERLIKIPPRKSNLIEDMYDISNAKKLLKKMAN